MAVKKAETLERQAEENKMISAWLWKNAAIAWLEAEDPPRSQESRRRSLQAPPEARTELLTMMWREGLGDVFLAAGDKPAAMREYTEAVKVAPSDALRKNVEKETRRSRQPRRSDPHPAYGSTVQPGRLKTRPQHAVPGIGWGAKIGTGGP